MDFKTMIENISKVMVEEKDYLIRIDNILGDGDLGLTMSDGFTAAFEAIESDDEEDLGKLSYKAGRAMMSAVPSTMGTLMGSGLVEAGKRLRDNIDFDEKALLTFLEGYFEGVKKLGKANLGEKTFLDGFYPGLKAYEEALEKNLSLKEKVELAYKAAEEGFRNTKEIKAVHGRAAFYGDKSKQHEDPGAAVAMLIFKGILNNI